jgi:NAD(P)-dependent dehydrogenase (short-subunit alcohol dehydrogenase family)
MSRVRDRVVVVTGASSGIGRASALAFAADGATVVVTARRAELLEEVAAACREQGVDAVAIPADVRDPDAVDAVAREAVGRFGRLDVWVNNAAVSLFSPVEEAPPEVWHGVIETNVHGVYHGIRAALPWMREQGNGVIINVSSVLGKVGSPHQTAYVASKHAVRALSNCTRQEVRDVRDIRVCTVLPGPIDTPLFEHAGNYTGRAIEPIAPVIDAHRVARTIVACAARPRREVVVGAGPLTLLGLNKLFPSLVERATAVAIERDHLADRPAAATAGNIVEPIAAGGAVSGGWSRSGRQVGEDETKAVSNSGDGPPLRALGVAGAVGVAAASAWARSRRP